MNMTREKSRPCIIPPDIKEIIMSKFAMGNVDKAQHNNLLADHFTKCIQNDGAHKKSERFPDELLDRVQSKWPRRKQAKFSIGRRSIAQWFGEDPSAAGAPLIVRDVILQITMGCLWKDYAKKPDNYYKKGEALHLSILGKKEKRIMEPIWLTSAQLDEFLADSLLCGNEIPAKFYYKTSLHFRVIRMLKRSRKVLVLGGPGTGKTSALVAIGLEKAELNWNVRWVDFAEELPFSVPDFKKELAFVRAQQELSILYIFDNVHLRPDLAYGFAKLLDAFKTCYIFSARSVFPESLLVPRHLATYLHLFKENETVHYKVTWKDANGIVDSYMRQLPPRFAVNAVSIKFNRMFKSCGSNLYLFKIAIFAWERQGFKRDVCNFPKEQIIERIAFEYLGLPRKEDADTNDVLAISVLSEFGIPFPHFPDTLSGSPEYYLKSGLVEKYILREDDVSVSAYLVLEPELATYILEAALTGGYLTFETIDSCRQRILTTFFENVLCHHSVPTDSLFLMLFRDSWNRNRAEKLRDILRWQKTFDTFSSVIARGKKRRLSPDFHTHAVMCIAHVVTLIRGKDGFQDYLGEFFSSYSEHETLEIIYSMSIDSEAIHPLGNFLLELTRYYSLNNPVDFKRIGQAIVKDNYHWEGVMLRVLTDISLSLMDEEQKAQECNRFLSGIDFYCFGQLDRNEKSGWAIDRLLSIAKVGAMQGWRDYLHGYGHEKMGNAFRVVISRTLRRSRGLRRKGSIIIHNHGDIFNHLKALLPNLNNGNKEQFVKGLSWNDICTEVETQYGSETRKSLEALLS